MVISATRKKECRCGAYEVFRYQKKISGPLLDRIDIQIEVPRVEISELRNKKAAPNQQTSVANSANQTLKSKIASAREIQARRFADFKPKIHTNSEMTSKQVEAVIDFDNSAEDFKKCFGENFSFRSQLLPYFKNRSNNRRL